MCGLYLFTSPVEVVGKLFKFKQLPNLAPNYNAAPAHEMPIIRLSEDGDDMRFVAASLMFVRLASEWIGPEKTKGSLASTNGTPWSLVVS